MATLTTEDRKKMSDDEFALPGHRFPLNDKNHDRLAISGATRAEHAGNISESQEEHIKSEARAKLGEGKDGDPKGGDPPADPKEAVAKMHPEHVHKLVKAASEGKFGPEAKATAQKAMASPGGSARQIFGAPDDDDDNDSPDDSAGTPASAASIFGGSGR